jgi:luciferase family oxidoreductase group 1
VGAVTGAVDAAGEPLALTVLDLGADLQVAVRLAPAVERMGYARYWFAEHPAQPNPHLLVALAAGVTDAIRVGVGGLCLAYHNSPLQPVLDVLLLERAFPGRIDLGICRGGADSKTTAALLRGCDAQAALHGYADKAGELVAILDGRAPPDAYPPTWNVPRATGAPELWSLGSGSASAVLAAQRGLSFAYSLFHSFSVDSEAHCASYRAAFCPTGHRTRPRVAIAVAGVCADSEARVDAILRAHQNPFCRPTVVGTPAACAEQIVALRQRYQMDELILVDICAQFRDKVRSYELFYEAAQSASARFPLRSPSAADVAFAPTTGARE